MEAPTQGTFGVLISDGFPLVPPTVSRSARPNSGRFAARHGTTTRSFAAFKAPTGGKGCAKCRGKGAMECPGCKGSGKNKKNGNLFERWKCFDCQGFGLVSCPNCGKGGLTPEQRGER